MAGAKTDQPRSSKKPGRAILRKEKLSSKLGRPCFQFSRDTQAISCTVCFFKLLDSDEIRVVFLAFDQRLLARARVCYTEYMPDFAAPVERLIDELKHLPGIGQKTAQRLAFHLLRAAPEDALGLADAIRDAKEKIRECSVCSNITDADPCLYCTGANRNKHLICVVEEAHNILAIEKTRTFNGMYHVLGGSLSPLQGRGPEQLKIKSLIERLKGGTVEEIIIATNPTAEGEATAVYLSKLLKPLGVRVTRIGVGIPVGADLEYADEITMLKAMEGRRDL